MGAEGETTPDPGAVEFLDLKVNEVSLVDKGAIRRSFSVVKALGDDDNGTEGDDMGKAGSKETKKDEGGNTTEKAAEVVSTDAVKAATPMLNALASERLGLVTAKVQEIQGSLGTMKKEDARTAMYALGDMVYDACRDVVSVSKALGVEPKPEIEALVEKAASMKHPRKMTARRRATLADIENKLREFAKEFDSEDPDTEDEEDTTMGTGKATEKTEGGQPATPPAAGASAAEITTIVTKAVTEATAPLAERIAALEKATSKTETPAAGAAGATAATETKKEEGAPTWVKDLQKSLGDLGKRIDTLEAGSNAAGGNRTDTKSTEKAEGNLWNGVL